MKYMSINEFQDYWKSMNNIEKAEKLSQSEIVFVRHFIVDAQNKGFPSSKTIGLLQKAVPKLKEKWKAERAYWTEVKHDDTKLIATASKDMGIDTYKTILSPDACQICKDKSNNGNKLFKTSDIQKAGYGHVPPFHPNCYCLMIPVVNNKK